MQQASYLESKVLTAQPQRLHLMLIEGAIQFGRRAEAALRKGENAAAAAALLRVVDIVSELLAGVRAHNSELNEKLADLYWFIFRRVSEAKINTDMAALVEALRLLEYERQTWQMLCDKLNGGKTVVPPTPHSRAFAAGPSSNSKSTFSLEA